MAQAPAMHALLPFSLGCVRGFGWPCFTVQATSAIVDICIHACCYCCAMSEQRNARQAQIQGSDCARV